MKLNELNNKPKTCIPEFHIRIKTGRDGRIKAAQTLMAFSIGWVKDLS